MTMEALVYPFLVANILFYLYETDFFVQYAKLFGLTKVFGIDRYEKHLENMDDTYWEWLVFEKRTFIRKLLSCPFCSGFWLNVGVYYFYQNIGVLILNLWISLFLYLTLKLVMKKCYE